MEKQIEELKQQLEKQCLINKELQRQNKDLGEYNNNYISFKYYIIDTSLCNSRLIEVNIGIYMNT